MVCWIAELRWEAEDRFRRFSVLVLVGLFGAVTMAVLGLPPVDLHGPLHRRGIMDPLCGGTRSVYLFARGHFLAAWQYNPLSWVLAAAAVLIVGRLVLGLATGRWPTVRFRRRRLIVTLAGLALIGLEVHQQLQAPLLMRVGA